MKEMSLADDEVLRGLKTDSLGYHLQYPLPVPMTVPKFNLKKGEIILQNHQTYLYFLGNYIAKYCHILRILLFKFNISSSENLMQFDMLTLAPTN